MTHPTALRTWMTTRLADLLNLPAAGIDPQASFADLGLSSLQAVQLSGDLEEHLGRAIDPTIVYEYPSVDALVDRLTGTHL